MSSEDLAATTLSAPAASGPSTYIVEPATDHTHTVIFLHGIGSNGERFGRELFTTGVTKEGHTLAQLLPGARFVFPSAPWRRLTALKRSRVTAWFDKARLAEPEYRKELTVPGLAESAKTLTALLHKERDSVPAENIVLGGISNGCAASLSVLLGLDYRIGGYVGLCGYLPFGEEISEAVSDSFSADDGEDVDVLFGYEEDREGNDRSTLDKTVRATVFERDLLELPPLKDTSLASTAHGTPVLIGHGMDDDVIPVALGKSLAETVRQADYDVTLKLYPGLGHWYKIPEGIDDIVEFLQTNAGWQLASPEQPRRA